MCPTTLEGLDPSARAPLLGMSCDSPISTHAPHVESAHSGCAGTDGHRDAAACPLATAATAVAYVIGTTLVARRSTSFHRQGPGGGTFFKKTDPLKVMLAYSHSLSLDHQGFRPFSPDHREAAGPVGPAAARVKVHCDLQTVPSCALATAWHSGHVGK